jgi:hypothetical protein
MTKKQLMALLKHVKSNSEIRMEDKNGKLIDIEGTLQAMMTRAKTPSDGEKEFGGSYVQGPTEVILRPLATKKNKNK